MSKSFLAAIALVCSLTSLPASASVVTVDFDQSSGSLSTSPYFEDGIRISVINCHYDIPARSGIDDQPGNFMGGDASGCDWDGNDPSTFPRLRLDVFGNRFDLISLDVMREIDAVISSDGGIITPLEGWPPFAHAIATGPEWKNIVWLDLLPGPHGAPIGWDTIVINIDEPNTIAMLLLALGLVGLLSRKHLAPDQLIR